MTTIDPSVDVIAIREAAKELRQSFAPMSMDANNLQRVKDSIAKLQTATNNINNWLDENALL